VVSQILAELRAGWIGAWQRRMKLVHRRVSAVEPESLPELFEM
jgi:hypothetical protein